MESTLNLSGPAPRLGDAPGTKYCEIPIVILTGIDDLLECILDWGCGDYDGIADGGCPD